MDTPLNPTPLGERTGFLTVGISQALFLVGSKLDIKP